MESHGGGVESVLKLAETDAAIAKKDLDDAIRVQNNTKTEPREPSTTIIFLEYKLITGPICRYQFGRTYQ